MERTKGETMNTQNPNPPQWRTTRPGTFTLEQNAPDGTSMRAEIQKDGDTHRVSVVLNGEEIHASQHPRVDVAKEIVGRAVNCHMLERMLSAEKGRLDALVVEGSKG